MCSNSFPVKAAKKVIVTPTDASGSNGFREVFIYDNSANGTDNPCDNATTVSLIGTPVVQPDQSSNPSSQDASNTNQPTSPNPTPIPTSNATEYQPPAATPTPVPVQTD